MELTRRDALAALAAGGVAVGVGATVRDGGNGSAPPTENGTASDQDATADGTTGPDGQATDAADGTAGLGAHERETLLAIAEVVYPSELTGVETFVGTYLDGRAADRPAYVSGVEAAIDRLDGMGREWYGGAFVDLGAGTQEQLLRETGADTAEPDPEGSPAERIRYYLVNELLYGLYSSPAGGELVGIENPQGYPGGIESYRRGPG